MAGKIGDVRRMLRRPRVGHALARIAVDPAQPPFIRPAIAQEPRDADERAASWKLICWTSLKSDVIIERHAKKERPGEYCKAAALRFKPPFPVDPHVPQDHAGAVRSMGSCGSKGKLR